MRIAHDATTPWTEVPPVRGGVIRFKTMLEGDEGRADNFHLLLADTDPSFASPRHRHNFDQIRVGLRELTNIGPRRNIEPGDLVYFPEGTHYGPQDQHEVGQSSLSMVVQFGGPSGNGYMSRRQLFDGQRELATVGTFEAGVYRRRDPADGERRNQDAYEAIWEHKQGRPLRYSRPRFLEPVHMRPGHFDWSPLEGSDGVSHKHLGSFTEGGSSVAMLRLEAGASHRLPDSPSNARLLFFTAGEGRVDGGGEWFALSAMHLAAGETATLRALGATEAVVLTLHRA